MSNEDGTTDDFYDHGAGCSCRVCEAGEERRAAFLERRRQAESAPSE